MISVLFGVYVYFKKLTPLKSHPSHPTPQEQRTNPSAHTCLYLSEEAGAGATVLFLQMRKLRLRLTMVTNMTYPRPGSGRRPLSASA